MPDAPFLLSPLENEDDAGPLALHHLRFRSHPLPRLAGEGQGWGWFCS